MRHEQRNRPKIGRNKHTKGLNLTGTLKHENAHTCARTMDSACESQDGMAVGRHGEGGEAGRQRVSNTAWCLS